MMVKVQSLCALRLAALLAIGLLISCSPTKPLGTGSGGGSGSAADKEASKSDPGERKTIAFVTNQIASFWNIAEVGCKDAGKEFDVNVDVRFPNEATATKQKQIVEDLLSSGIDALAISPIDADNQKEMVNQWAEKIPLLTHDSDAPGTNRLMYIGMDNYHAGRLVGKLIRQAKPEGAKVILTIGRLEQDNAKKRRQGVIDELLDRPDDDQRFDPVESEIAGEKYTILATLTDQGKPEVAKQKVEDALNTYPDVEVIAGLFAYNPPAILQALKQANLLDKIAIAGFDEDDATLQGIKDGHVIGTVVQNPYQYGYQSIKILSHILNGDASAIPPNKFIDITARTIDKTNVDEFWADLKSKTGATSQ